MISIESLGLPKSQESAVKKLVIHKLYDNYNDFKENIIEYVDNVELFVDQVKILENNNKSVKIERG